MSIRKILNDDKKLDSIAKIAFCSVDKDGSGLIDFKEMEIVILRKISFYYVKSSEKK